MHGLLAVASPGCVLASALASLLWLVAVGRLGAPRGRMVAAFLAGMLSSLGVTAFSALVSQVRLPLVCGLSPNGGGPDQLAYFVLLVGLVEEGCMLGAIRASVCLGRPFATATEGVAYAAAASLGFAVIENAGYLARMGTAAFLLRVVVSTPGHVLFAAVWGMALGLQCTGRMSGTRGWAALLAGLACASLLHGAYDALLYNGRVWLAVLLLAALGRLLFVRLRGLTEGGRPAR